MKKWTKLFLTATLSLSMIIQPVPMSIMAQTTTITENNEQVLPEGFENTLVHAWKEMQSSIDISAYKLSNQEVETYYNEVLNAHPELFYVENHSVFWTSDSPYIASVKQNYDSNITKDEIATEISKFNSIVEEAVSLITSDMEDYEKALVIHDWLATHCAYDYENYLKGMIPKDSYTVYGALVNKKAVCEGYSKTYRYLMQDKLGIPCQIVSSSSMSHAWNMILIDGKYYHVDVTWDDPVWNDIGKATHTYFLLSDHAIKDGTDKNPHSGWDGNWTATDNTYENVLWTNCDGSMIPYDGNWYYTQYNENQCYLMKTDDLLNGTPKSVYTIGSWKTGENGNWTSCFSYPAVYQNELIFNGPKEIYRMPFDSEEVTVLYTPPTEEVDAIEEGIYGLELEDTKLSYAIQTTPNREGSQNSYIKTINNPAVKEETEKPKDDEPEIEESEEEDDIRNEITEISLTIKGTENYIAANEVFQLVNAARKENGLAELYLDKDMTEAAMQRAAEIAINFSHTRPNGDSCFSAFPNINVSMAENIAAGQKTAEGAMDSWLNSAGHYANIMKSDMKNIGIGCFVDDRGSCYWVQCFDSALKHTATTITNQIVTRTIPVQAGVISLSAEKSKTYKCNDTTTETMMVIRNINPGFSYGMPSVEALSFKFTSDNEEVAKVDAVGKITLQGMGKATITAALKGEESIRVSQIIEIQGHQEVTTDTKTFCASCGTVLWEETDTEQDEDPSKDEPSNEGGIGDTPKDEPSDKENTEDTSKDETPDKGNTEDTSKDETPDKGNTEDTSKDETPDKGNTEDTSKDETLNEGDTGDIPKDEKPDEGGAEESPNDESSDKGDTEDTLKDEIPDKGNTEESPKEKIPDGGTAGEESSKEIEETTGKQNAQGNTISTPSGTGTYTQSITPISSQEKDITTPKKVTISKIKKKKKYMVISWKKDASVTGYEIRYSLKKNFSSAKTSVIKKNTVTKKTIKKLKPNKRYYVSIRSYKDVVVNGATQRLYSPWNTKKSK